MTQKSLLRAFLSLLLLFMILATGCSAVPVYAASTWNVQIVDENGYLYDDHCPIVVDSNNNPHISYSGFTLPYKYSIVKYASWNESSWNSQEIASFATTFDLVLDSHNNPHVLYGSGGLKYASWTGSNWVNQTVDSNGGFGSVALDSSNIPHLAYKDGQAVKYAVWTGIFWNIQTVENVSESATLSLSLDQNNTVYIMYQSDGARLAVYQDSSWDIQAVATDLNTLGNMILDSEGYPHFIYTVNYGFNNSTLKYSHWNGASWITQDVVSNTAIGYGWTPLPGSLALDSNDFPHIAYITSTPELMYAKWTGTTWNIQNVENAYYNITQFEATTSAESSCYLALDSNGNPHISYRIILGHGYSDARSFIMYATATNLTDALALWIAVVVVTIAVLAVIVYFWKKKRKH